MFLYRPIGESAAGKNKLLALLCSKVHHRSNAKKCKKFIPVSPVKTLTYPVHRYIFMVHGFLDTLDAAKRAFFVERQHGDAQEYSCASPLQHLYDKCDTKRMMSMRKYIRHPADIPITYKLNDIVAYSREYLKNISVGGLCFRAGRYLQKGSLISIQIPLTHPIFQEQGRVSWCRPSNGHYDVGVEFLDENTQFRARMIEQVCYIEHYKREIQQTEGRRLSAEEAAIEWIQKYAKDFPGQIGEA